MGTWLQYSILTPLSEFFFSPFLTVLCSLSVTTVFSPRDGPLLIPDKVSRALLDLGSLSRELLCISYTGLSPTVASHFPLCSHHAINFLPQVGRSPQPQSSWFGLFLARPITIGIRFSSFLHDHLDAQSSGCFQHYVFMLRLQCTPLIGFRLGNLLDQSTYWASKRSLFVTSFLSLLQASMRLINLTIFLIFRSQSKRRIVHKRLNNELIKCWQFIQPTTPSFQRTV